MKPRRRPNFKTSQIYDWDTEPRQERDGVDSVFRDTIISGYQSPRPARRQRGLSALSRGLFIVGALGFVGVLTLARFLHH